jgi:hypothetical protein
MNIAESDKYKNGKNLLSRKNEPPATCEHSVCACTSESAGQVHSTIYIPDLTDLRIQQAINNGSAAITATTTNTTIC